MAILHNVRTQLSLTTKQARGATVIRFIDAPRYRGFDVDISADLPIELLGISIFRGRLRAEVTSTYEIPGTCHLLIENRRFEVFVRFNGVVSQGISLK